MKELKDMTTAELVAKHELLTYQVQALETVYETTETDLSDFVVIENLKEELAAYTAELDARCEKAEISIINRAGMNQFKYGAYIDGTNGVWLGIPAVEQHALEGYLLSKEVKP